MDKEFIWNVFKKTGSIEVFLEYIEYKRACEKNECKNSRNDNKRD